MIRRRNSAVVALLAAAMMGFVSPQAGAAGAAPLKPAQAYRYEAIAGSDSVTVRWKIEPGYYLYKKKMSYASKSPGVSLGEAVLPAGLPHTDEYFGTQEIYRDDIVVRIPVLKRDTDQLELEIRSQGCADLGLCYPPQVWSTLISFPSANAPSKSLFEKPLPADQAFRPEIEIVDPFHLRVRWTIADGYYLYRHTLSARVDGPGVSAGSLKLPPGLPKDDESFGKTEVFFREAVGDLALTRAGPAAVTAHMRLSYQGCKENSICYPTQMFHRDIALPVASAADRPPERGRQEVSEQDRLAKLIGGGNILLVMATFAGLGLLLAFTPCVLPMVPILSGIIVGDGKNTTTGRAFVLSLAYVLGMAVTYTAAGAGFAAAGGQIQAALQKPWIIVGVALLFVALALSMFGVYEIQMPAGLQTRLTASGNRQKTGTLAGTVIMGALSALVVTTCVAPPLVAALTVIAQTGDILRGSLALFAMSIGMGIPLLVIGTSAGRLLPRAGGWMVAVKGAFGFMMLGLAVWMLDRIVPAPVTLALWGVLAFMGGVFMGAFQSLGAPASVPQRLGKGFGLLIALYGAVLLLGALSGARDPLRPLDTLLQGRGSQTTAADELKFSPIKTVEDLDRALGQHKPAMLDFYADWCVSCKEMEHDTFRHPDVSQALAGAVLLRADVTANDDADKMLLSRFGIFGPPTIVFFGPDGRERDGMRVVGYEGPKDFAAHVRRALAPPAP
jgi:thiol:disulfide interchange protein DsbD